MGKQKHPQPKQVPAKLFEIRRKLGLSQTKMLRLLKVDASYNRVSEFERGARFPGVLILLAYARVARVPLEQIVDDDLKLSM